MKQWAPYCRTLSIRRSFRERVSPMRFGHQTMTCWTRRAVARSFVPAIAAIVFAGPFQTKPTDGKLLCQGQYSRKNTIRGAANAWLPTDRWRVYMLPDRSYAVQTELEPFDKETSIRQTFTLASDFRQTGFSSNSKWHNISCEFNATRLQCSIRVTFPNNSSGSASLDQTPPYVFMPVADAFPFDLTWFCQTLVSQLDHTAGRKIKLPVISIREGKSKDEIELGIEEWEQVEYLGQEKITILNREILAHKFREDDAEKPGGENRLLIWMSDSGIVLQISSADEGPDILLTDYQGPPL
jgi:hypothetical protein